MQKFNLHAHTKSTFFDGKNTVLEMLQAYEKLGFEAVGISNHLTFHPKMRPDLPMFFCDPEKAKDAYIGLIDEIKEARQHVDIDVLVGFEVDFFPSSGWRTFFEDLIKDLKPDYLIGSTHNLRLPDESELYNIYFEGEKMQDPILLQTYFDNIKETIKSGYFDFIAHLDVLRKFIPDFSSRFMDEFVEIAELLQKHKTATEINTGGLRCGLGSCFPTSEIVDVLKSKDISLLISDDAHGIHEAGTYFHEAEELLADYPHRFTLSDLKSRKKGF